MQCTQYRMRGIAATTFKFTDQHWRCTDPALTLHWRCFSGQILMIIERQTYLIPSAVCCIFINRNIRQAPHKQRRTLLAAHPNLTNHHTDHQGSLDEISSGSYFNLFLLKDQHSMQFWLRKWASHTNNIFRKYGFQILQLLFCEPQIEPRARTLASKIPANHWSQPAFIFWQDYSAGIASQFSIR